MKNIFWLVYCHIANCGRKGESVDNSKRIMFSVHLFCLRNCTLKHSLIGVVQSTIYKVLPTLFSMYVTGFMLYYSILVLHTSCVLKFSASLKVCVLCQFWTFEQNLSSAQNLFLLNPSSTSLPYSANSYLRFTSDTPSFRVPFLT